MMLFGTASKHFGTASQHFGTDSAAGGWIGDNFGPFLGSIVLLLVGTILAQRLRPDLPFDDFDIYSVRR
jgi:hypothetical protein